MEKKLKILAAADLHGNLELSKRLANRALEEQVDLVIIAGDINDYHDTTENIFDPFREAGKKVVFIPGNADSLEEHLLLGQKAKSIHDYYVSYGGIGITGIGNSDWKLSFDEYDFGIIERNFKKMKHEKKILVSHLHAKDLIFERLGFYGDEILRNAVEQFQPDILISAHIHEIEGLEDTIGKTRVVQVGRSGTILEI
ncbi:hypothetical protein HN604_00405 [archaeon]|jgi:Icc-related predicted phosphoesterase|nr:hypothetical protein [archaeon]MBT6182906.1 hypothetical protein [archaeon]MBT6606783.1 hypothetical protein [archaeon]MBT7251744.1 hypothetical protein [archaeon]MBT7660527.1 hypothetical protein [archaeon]